VRASQLTKGRQGGKDQLNWFTGKLQVSYPDLTFSGKRTGMLYLPVLALKPKKAKTLISEIQVMYKWRFFAVFRLLKHQCKLSQGCKAAGKDLPPGKFTDNLG
jgi:hypothetical protein